jgi:uncharacterized membrane protein
MSNLIVITFDNPDEAEKVRETLRSGQKHDLIKLDDSAIVVKDEDGQVHVKNELDRGVKVGIAGGGLLGLWIGFIFGGPIGAALLGAAGGALVGASTDMGLQKKFIKEVSAAIKPNSSALFIIVRDSNPNAAVAALKPYKGEVYYTSLDPEAEETLRSILKTEIK